MQTKRLHRKKKSKSSIPLLIDSSGDLVVDDLQKANLLSAHFCSVFIKDNGMIPSTVYRKSHDNTDDKLINSVNFTSVNVYYQIKKLKSSSAPGLDGISAFLLKKNKRCIFPFVNSF